MLRKASAPAAATPSAVQPGRLKPASATSSYRGVSYNTQLKRWKSVITVGRSQHFLGYYDDEIAAAKAYDAASLKMRGPEAPVNFPAEVVRSSGSAMELESGNSMAIEFMQQSGTGNSLPHLGNGTGLTNESVESVRDPVLELQAVKMTLEMQQKRANVPATFLSL